MTPRGMYERTRAYERLDVVTYQGSSWVAIVDVPAHISPALGSDYWQLQARMGETGPQGPVGPQGNSAFMNDGTVNKYELVNNLTQGGENAVLSAEQGKILKQELTELESKLLLKENVAIEKRIDGYYIGLQGKREEYYQMAIFGGVPIKKGEIVTATCFGLNSAISPIGVSSVNSYFSNMNCEQVVTYQDGEDTYKLVAEFDGYVFISSNKDSIPTLEVSSPFDFAKMENNINTSEQRIESLSEEVASVSQESKQNTQSVNRINEIVYNTTSHNVAENKREGYYIGLQGNREEYHQFAIFGGTPVKKGDIITATCVGLNSIISPIGVSSKNSFNSDMNCEQVATYQDGENTYRLVAELDGYVFVSSNKDSVPTLEISSVYDFKSIENDASESVAALKQEQSIPVTIERYGYYVDTQGARQEYTNFSIYTPIKVNKGDAIEVGNIDINEAVCPLAFSEINNTTSAMQCIPLAVYAPNITTYNARIEKDGYVYVTNSSNVTPIVKITSLLDAPTTRKIGNILSDKVVMLFGDSLTAGSTEGVVSFSKFIADRLDIPYKAFVFDRFDNNAEDVDVDYPCVVNYGKDGTKNQVTSERSDSILQRVKNHVLADTKVDYILVECSVNDYTSGVKGQISDSYEAEFDVNTAIGAIEETCRYLTTLGKNIRIGFWIPWGISYVPDNYFDEYSAVFEKWGIPLYDMRKCAGFDMRHCTRHRELYSLPSSAYSDYNNAAVYNLDDKVKYEGWLYKCNADNVSGIPPTNEAYWTRVSSGDFDGCHLNSLGHYIVAGKIQSFIERL